MCGLDNYTDLGKKFSDKLTYRNLTIAGLPYRFHLWNLYGIPLEFPFR